jgi:hypothetical protein
LKASTGADLQHLDMTSVVFEGSPLMLPTAQAMSAVGKRVKSAVEQDEELAEGAVEVCVSDILVVVAWGKISWGRVSEAGYNAGGRCTWTLDALAREQWLGVTCECYTCVCCCELFLMQSVDSNISRAMIKESSRNCAFVLFAHGIL